MQDFEKCQEHAIALRNKGYNCAQCVLMSLSEYIGLDEKAAARMSAAYGNGFGGFGGMCGAVAILGIATGLMSKGSEPHDKSEIMWRSKNMLEKFMKANDGDYQCHVLKGKENAKTCPEHIKTGVRLFFEEHPDAGKTKSILSGIKKALNV